MALLQVPSLGRVACPSGSFLVGGDVSLQAASGHEFAGRSMGRPMQVSFNGGANPMHGLANPELLTSPGSSANSAISRSRRRSTVGRGASAAVQVHIDEDGKAILAEKVITTFSAEKAAAARQELRFAARQLQLDSQPPELVRIHGAYHDDAEHCTHVLMEYMDAGHAGRLAPLAEPALAALARQLCAGLRVLHEELRVVHRDIKPENVLLASGGAAKLADFGVAALLEAGEDSVTDQQGSIMQMAPERLRGEAHGFASDVWALGVTVAQLATGAHPFAPEPGSPAATGATERFWALAEVIKHTASGAECEAATRAAVARSLEASSAELRAFVDACTATEPAARPTAAELLQHPFIAKGAGVDLSFPAVDLPEDTPASRFGPLEPTASPPGHHLAVSADDWD